ncbi:MAG: hypothetical protein JXI43_12445 [Tissierellales bacterium]|nr:hypothetical protein [Tissierellales bacterium]
MGRSHTFMDREFGRSDYDQDDSGEFEKNLVFLAMPFDKDMRDNYKIIKDECSKLSLNVVRVDENVGSGFIIREITELIERAEFIIFDLTYERPNVYYELGYAHGVGNEAEDILLIAREGTNIHFDISPMRTHYYESNDQLRDIINRNLKSMIRITRN